MQAEKKCPSCEKWTGWNQQLDARCEHCNELLQEDDHSRIEEVHRKEKEYQENIFYHPREGDGVFLFLVRKIAMVLHVIFAALTWGFMWFTVTFSG